MLQLELLVTGTGRSGTGFLAKSLTEAGLPCTHEGLFGPYGPMSGHEGRAESSWMAVPFLECVDVPVALVVREPHAVVQSLLGIRFFENLESPYFGFTVTHAPEIGELPPVDAAWKFWLHWNQWAMESADVVFTLEGNWSNALASVAALEPSRLIEAGETVGIYNHRDRAPDKWVLQGDKKLIAEATRFYDHLSI